MITVVDQVRPWLTPSSTLAKTTQPHDGAQISSSGTGRPMSQPATSTGLRPYRSERVPAKKLVAAFTTPKATMNVSAAVNAVSPNTSLGEQRQDGAFLADHPADERVDGDEQGELGEVLAQPEPDRRRRVDAWSSCAGVEAAAGGGRPVVGAADEHGDVGVAAGGEEAGARSWPARRGRTSR